MKLPIGYSDFRKIIEQKFDFVDKSLLIKEMVDDGEVTLITRPRRFGKTLNLSMLHYFFASEVRGEETRDLFKTLKINLETDVCAKHQGKYAVIYLTFKDMKEYSYQAAYEKIIQILGNIYDEFSKILQNSEKLTAFQKQNISNILNKQVSQAEVEDALRMLSKCLYDHYGQKVCILTARKFNRRRAN